MEELLRRSLALLANQYTILFDVASSHQLAAIPELPRFQAGAAITFRHTYHQLTKIRWAIPARWLDCALCVQCCHWKSYSSRSQIISCMAVADVVLFQSSEHVSQFPATHPFWKRSLRSCKVFYHSTLLPRTEAIVANNGREPYRLQWHGGLRDSGQ